MAISERGRNPVAMTVINPREEIDEAENLAGPRPVLKFSALPTLVSRLD